MKKITLLACLIFGICGMCIAQTNRASLSGTVTDPNGAVISGAKVTAMQTNTKYEFTATANADGVYSFVGLPIGEYEIDCERPGFKRVTRPGIVLDPAADVRVDLQLPIGSVTDTVQVKAESPLVDTRSTTYGNELDAKAIKDLPLQISGESRGVYSLLAAVPGVTNQGFSNNVFGGEGLSSQILVDGLGAEYAPTVPGVQERPQPVDSIANFQVVQTSSAEYSLSGGGVMNVTTKSGTNNFHGSVFEYLRNDSMDARAFFAQRRAPDKENEYGFTLGGPIRHNKTFFWGEYDAFRTASSQGGAGSASSGAVLTLPTQSFMTGNFAALLGPQIGTDALGRPVYSGEIYDPDSTRVVNGQTIRDPFPGNVIPQNRLSAISQTVQGYFPKLTYPDQLVNNFIGAAGDTITEPQYIAKITQKLGQGNLDVSERVVIHNQNNTYPLPPVLSTWNNFNQHNYSTRIAYTVPLGPQTDLSLLMGFDRQAGLGYHSAGLQSQFGINGLYSKDCTTQISVAQMVFTSPASDQLGDGFCDYDNRTTSWKYAASVTHIVGKHMIKVGGNYFRWLENLRYLQGSQGSFSYSTQETGLPGTYLSQTGFGYASFLLGQPYAASVDPNSSVQMRDWEFGLFAQDEFRITPKLTVNYGAHYDFQPQYTTPGNYQSQFNATIPNLGANRWLGAIEFAGYGPGRCNCTRWSPTYLGGIAPRFGFAYQLAKNTVVRGSYGLYRLQVSEYAGENQGQYGFLPSSSLSDLDAGVSPILNWQNGYPSFSLAPSLDPTVQNGRSAIFLGHDDASPSQVQIGNVSVQHQLGQNTLLEVSYMRNIGHHLGTGNMVLINQLDFAKYGSYGDLLNQDVYSQAAVSAGITAPYPGFTGTVAQALRPYPQYLTLNDNDAKVGNSSYNALIVTASRRFTNGLSFLVGYTLSKNMSDIGSDLGTASAGIQNAYDRRAEWAVTGVDQRHAVVATYTYDLPFGAGRQFVSGSNFVDSYLIGGWKISGINNYSTGTPLSITTDQGLPTVAFGIRPNIVSGVDPRGSGSCGGGTPGQMLNPGAFEDPAPFTFGDAPRASNNVRTCPNLNESVSLVKSFPVIRDRIAMEFGANFFNVFNRHEFSFATDIDSLTYGTVNGSSGPRQGQVYGRITW